MPAKTGRKRGNNEGSVRQRPDGRWEARVWVDQRQRSFYGRTRKEAWDRAVAALRDVQQGLPVPDGRLTLGTFLDDWVANVAPHGLRDGTLRRYRQDVARIDRRLGKIVLSSLTPQRVQSFLNELSAGGLAPASVRHCRAVLRRALEHAVKLNLIQRNPARGGMVQVPKLAPHRVEGLTADDARRLVAFFRGHWLENFVTLALHTGMRHGELAGLRWEFVDLDRARVSVFWQAQYRDRRWAFTPPKSDKSRRTLPLSPAAVEALRSERGRRDLRRLLAGDAWREQDLVFSTRNGTPLGVGTVLRSFHAVLECHGRPRMRIHDLRHGTASLLLEQGASLKEISEFLGHSQISITADLYAHLSPLLQQESARRLQAALAG
jgi:integrase